MKYKKMKLSVGITASLLTSSLLTSSWVSAAPIYERTLLPTYTAEQITKLCDEQIEQTKQQLNVLASQPIAPNRSASQVLAKWDKIFAQFENFSGPVSFYGNVDPDAKLRQASEACEIKISEFQTDIFQNAKLYQQIKSSKATNEIDQKYQTDILQSFENTGINLNPEQQLQLKQINEQLNKIEQTYARNVRDNPQKLEFSRKELNGLPQSYIDGLKRNAKGLYVLGFDYPEYRPFMELAENDAARKRYYIAFTRRGGEQNLQLLKQAMDLRYDLAQLFGKSSYAEWVLQRRMAKTPAAVDQFLATVHTKVAPLEKKEVENLQQFKAKTLNIPFAQAKIERWSEAYWSEKLRKAKFQVDQEKLRAYFPTQAAQDWIFAMSSTLYDIDFKPAKVPVWQNEVEYYDVVDRKTGELLGGLYLDKFPRQGKYGHAAVWSIYGGSALIQRKPVSALVTNFNRQGLNQDELTTFVHEFGHALHGILSKTRYASQSGTSVERDFVEAPSQMYEEWARRTETLSKVADYCSPKCPRVDAALVKRLNAAERYGRGLFYARQTLYAQYDMALHTSQAKQLQPLSVWKEMEGKTALGYVPTTEFPGQFGHLMGGYQAGYYGYMWSKVLALDMLSAFSDNLNNPVVGQRYRATILSQGGQKKAEQMVEEFLGRKPNNTAFFDEITGQRDQ